MRFVYTQSTEMQLVFFWFNRQSAFLLVPTVHLHLFLSTCSFIRPRHAEYFIQGFLKHNKKKLARSFNFTFRHIYDVIWLSLCKIARSSVILSFPYSLNNWWFCWSDPSHWKKGYNRYRYVCLVIHLEIDSEGLLRTKCYDNRDDSKSPLKTGTELKCFGSKLFLLHLWHLSYYCC